MVEHRNESEQAAVRYPVLGDPCRACALGHASILAPGHVCGDGQVIYVPLCEPHIEVAPTTRIECEMTTHLFFGGPQ